MCGADCFLCCFSLQAGAIFASSYMFALSILGLLLLPFIPFTADGNFLLIYGYMLLLFVAFIIALFGALSESKPAVLGGLVLGIIAFLLWVFLTLPSFLDKETPNCFGYRCGESHWLLARQWTPHEDREQIRVYTTPKLNLLQERRPSLGSASGYGDEDDVEGSLNGIKYGDEDDTEAKLNGIKYGADEEDIEDLINAKHKARMNRNGRLSNVAKRGSRPNNQAKKGKYQRSVTEYPSSDYEELIVDLLKVLNPLMTAIGGSSITSVAELLKNNENYVNGSYVRNLTVESMRRTFETSSSLEQLLIHLLQNSEQTSEPVQSQYRSQVLDKLKSWSQVLSRFLHKSEFHDQNETYRTLFGNLSSPLALRTVNHQKTIIQQCNAHRPESLVRPNETVSTILGFLYGLAFLTALTIIAMYYGSLVLAHRIEKCCVSECLISCNT